MGEKRRRSTGVPWGMLAIGALAAAVAAGPSLVADDGQEVVAAGGPGRPTTTVSTIRPDPSSTTTEAPATTEAAPPPEASATEPPADAAAPGVTAAGGPGSPGTPTTRPAPSPPRPACAAQAAGCVSGWTVRTQTCLDRAPATAADYQRAFDDRRIWGGADVAKPVTLPDGRILWLYGDTLTALDAYGGMAGPMLRNSLVVQNDRCFSFLHGGTAADPTTPLPSSGAFTWFWPTSATVDHAGNAVRIVGKRMVDDPNAMFGWRVTGTDVVSLRASDLALQSVVAAPIPQDDRVTWNGSALTTGGYTFIYALRKDHQIVARTSPSTIAWAPWEFWTGNGWSTDIDAARQPEIEQAPAAEFTIVPHAGGFLASSKKAEMNSDDVSTWWSPTPVGPWRYQGRAAHTAGAGTPYMTYAGQVVPLPGAGFVTIWSQNGRGIDAGFDFRRYGPRFGAPLPGSVP